MLQYNAIKAKYPGALLLFRVGDFYETFGQDAIKASGILGIVLTKRGNGSGTNTELAGFPHHSLETYLPKLVRAGQRVAICDQLEDPKTTKTIVKRGVTELITPGVSYSDNIIQQNTNNYLASLYFEKNSFGIAFIDISTGEFLVAQGNADYIDKLLQSFKPSEVIFQKSRQRDFTETFGDRFYTYHLDDWAYSGDYASEFLLKHFDVKSLKGFGIEKYPLAIIAAGVALHYLNETEHRNLQHISSVSRIEEDRYMWLDRFTIRNLELIGSANENAVSLVDVLDKTCSPMGARLLRRWIIMPLKELKPIQERLDVVEFLVGQDELREKLLHELKQIGDLERLISKIGLQKANPREVLQLKRALYAISNLKELCQESESFPLKMIAEQFNPCVLIRDKIERELNPDSPVMLAKGSVIADGVDEELDRLRKIAFGGKGYLLEIQKREAEITGIPSLKVAFNNVFGYYLEVTHTHKDKVPAEWLRKQTLVNAERYITPELKEYEEQILGAEEKIQVLETRLYNELTFALSEFIKPIQLNAQLVAQLDVLMNFASLAIKNYYVKPVIDESSVIDIKGGRHPVIERNLPPGEEYITNDVFLDSDTQQIIIITGPNMSGKSALLRQTGLIVLMAQMGCFVPAKEAQIGLVDKIYTRVGASDNLTTGESTFMVEMNETASILNNLSPRSLILMDEIGRGTSTYDGISIAWSIAEYLHNHPAAKAKTLFATHYHELNELTNSFSRIKNFNVSVKELGNKVIFLRKLVPGGSEHSFGIHVAKMAGMPPKLVSRANEILKRLEQERTGGEDIKDSLKKVQKQAYQLQMFSIDDPVLVKIRDMLNNLEVNTLTPVEALMKLDEIQRVLKS
ncbi:MAG: DNA mismatch repair protein MutS [Sphingobacteriales bacterium 17-39-43]|uniref:DNA mismatch repair protein MutS n=1 Tax=Daejeonella sp. TaxID=2805397 RepID=UPI000BC44DD0|nr:DNA mismatch repair protein MutS [Daejeonella sp.]OYY05467.1 MAG: DNA mismatch repair protein MutS [Sphingobacteriia bacterium 35-40-5]OYZ33529.1 MAG: DNA mismatch repair protein MutS [Sphingobacteriales bacterium 16-39-50]OZA26786.1 MAG: DNA mismatch repair protein MutS [Sphingobacteriales bacterium 17-39-43]HQT21658.1 DNA mismatch repair protein MutS [Daejeonella sp.]HQT56389.1 DNA mismatch repair protein MutS [Daejeonella sp.]